MHHVIHSDLSIGEAVVREGSVSTTGADWVDEVETGWTESQARGLARTWWMKNTTLPR